MGCQVQDSSGCVNGTSVTYSGPIPQGSYIEMDGGTGPYGTDGSTMFTIGMTE